MTDVFKKVGCSKSGVEFELWITWSAEPWEYCIEVRQDECRLLYSTTDGQKAHFKYYVSFEVELDSKIQSFPSPLQYMIDRAKADLDKFQTEKVVETING